MNDEPPKQPTTVEMPAVPGWAIDLTTTVKDGFRQVNARLDAVESNLDLQGGSVVDLGKRMTLMEERVGKVEGASLRPRLEAESKTNMEQDAAIATILTDVSAIKADLSANTAITQQSNALTVEFKKSMLSGLRHPAFQALIMAAIAYAMAYLGRHT